MSWLFGESWPWVVLAGVLGAAITLFLMLRKISWETLRARRTVSEVGADVAAPAADVDLDGAEEVDVLAVGRGDVRQHLVVREQARRAGRGRATRCEARRRPLARTKSWL